MQEKEREKQAKQKKVQEHINRTREQNAKRKLDKVCTKPNVAFRRILNNISQISNREWDSEKKGGQWKDFKADQGSNEADANRPPPAKIDIRGAVRGGGPSRGRGRGRGRGGGGGGPNSARPSGTTEPKSPQTPDENARTPSAPAPDASPEVDPEHVVEAI